MLQISLQYFVAFEKYNYLNLNAHFQSQRVIELRNVLLLLKKNEWPPNSPDIMCGPNDGKLSKIHAKTAQHLPQEFINKAIPSFRKS